MNPIAAVVLSYVSGSIPAAYLAGKWSGVDLRAHGSGNLGATNVVRVLGPRVGALVFAVDIAKGALPVRLLPPLSTTNPDLRVWIAVACAVAAILGHIRPVFLGFGKGGKGVATACGVFLALAPLAAALALAIFAVVVSVSGFVSLASLTAAAALPVFLGLGVGVLSPLFYIGLLTTFFVFWTHRPNIGRLRAGTEYRFGRGAKLGVLSSVTIGVVAVALAALLVTRVS